MQKVFLKGIANALIKSYVGPLAHAAIDDIVITNSLHASLGTHHLVWLLGNSAEWLREANTNKSFQDKIQLVNLLKLLVNDLVLLGRQESARQQALREQGKQLFVRCRAPREESRLEETGEFFDDVGEQIIDLNRLFYLLGNVHHLCVCWIVEVLIPIILQIKAVVTVNGVVKRRGQRQAIAEPLGK
jgi:hypothetical protein